MKTFDSLTEQEVLALAISLEEEDARIYEDFADGLQENYPEQAAKFREMRRDEDGHRHRLLELYKSRFGDHVPLIRRQDVRGFVDRKPVWLVRPLGLKAVQKTAESMEVETRRFYEAAGRRTTDTGIRQLLGDLAEEERNHAHTAEQIAHTKLSEDEKSQAKRLFLLQVVQPGLAGLMDGSVSTLAPIVRRRVCHAQQLGQLFSSGWRRASARASAWDLPRRCPTTAASPGAAIRGRADLSAAR